MAAAKFGRSTKLWKQRNKEKQKHVKTNEAETLQKIVTKAAKLG
jgi:hypothetical protein